MPEHPRQPDLDERFTLPEDADPDEVLSRLLESDGVDTVSEDPEEDPEDG